MFQKYKIVNREHNREKACREQNLAEGAGAPLVIEDPAEILEPFIRPIVEDIPWVKLTKAEKETIKTAEHAAINTAKYTRQSIPHFLNKIGDGKYLSIN